MGHLLDHVVCAGQSHQGPCGGKFRVRKIKKRFSSARRVFERTSREICAPQSETLEECVIKRSIRADLTRNAVVKGVKRG